MEPHATTSHDDSAEEDLLPEDEQAAASLMAATASAGERAFAMSYQTMCEGRQLAAALATAAEYEEELDRRTRFHDYVRSEYEAKGYVHVSDEYIARRAEAEEFSRKLFEEMGLDDDSDSDYSDDHGDGEEEEEAAH